MLTLIKGFKKEEGENCDEIKKCLHPILQLERIYLVGIGGPFISVILNFCVKCQTCQMSILWPVV